MAAMLWLLQLLINFWSQRNPDLAYRLMFHLSRIVAEY
jgi:hypothetical protein